MKDGFNSIQVTDLISSRDKIRTQIELEVKDLERLREEIKVLEHKKIEFVNSKNHAEEVYKDSFAKLTKLKKDVNTTETTLSQTEDKLKEKQAVLQDVNNEIKRLEIERIKAEGGFNGDVLKYDKIINDLKEIITEQRELLSNINQEKSRLEAQNLVYIEQNKEIEKIKNEIEEKKKEFEQLNKLSIKYKSAVLTEMFKASGAERTK